MSGALYGAEEMHGGEWSIAWSHATRCSTEAGDFARALADGPTLAHAATKRVVRAQADHGTRGADERTAELTSHLFETSDSRMRCSPSCSTAPGRRVSLVIE